MLKQNKPMNKITIDDIKEKLMRLKFSEENFAELIFLHNQLIELAKGNFKANLELTKRQWKGRLGTMKTINKSLKKDYFTSLKTDIIGDYRFK